MATEPSFSKALNKKTHNSNSHANGKEVTGTFMVPFNGSGVSSGNESSDEDETEERDGFLDYRDIQGGGNLVRVRIPPEKTVELKDKAGKKHTCSGKFLMAQPYWEVTVRMKSGKLRSAPIYSLRSDLDEIRSTNMVRIFLSDCLQLIKDFDKQNGTQACFEQFCGKINLKHLVFTELEKLLSDYVLQEKFQGCFLGRSTFAEHGGLTEEDHSEYIKRYVFESDLGASVLAAASFPELIATLSRLFPYSFPQILNKLSSDKNSQKYSAKSDACKEDTENDSGKEKETKQKKRLRLADTMAQTSPWEFCFREIVIKKLRLYGVEATLRSYEDSGFLSITPLTQKDALYIYEVMKCDARKHGHMYMPFRVLRDYNLFKSLQHQINGLERWRVALEYLEVNGVTKTEEFGGDRNIFLYRNWQAEVDTTETVKLILDRHQENPLVWDVDLLSPDFKNLRSDYDQLRACLLICSTPIVVMSGRGGCGKTTVITSLLKHLLAREKKRLAEKESEKESNAVDDPERHIRTCHQANAEEHKSVFENLSQPSSVETTNPSSQTLEGSLSGLALSGPAMNQYDYTSRPSTSTSKAPHEQQHKLVPIFTANVNSAPDLDLAKNVQTLGEEDKPKVTIPEVASRPQEGRSKAEILKRELVSDLLKILAMRNSEEDDSELNEYKQKMLLTAPTGKAARLLGCKAGLPSVTLHSVLASWQVHVAQLSTSNKGEWKYANVEILVVDECSLVSTRLFANVAKILVEHAGLRKIVLLGDVRQLPSIEAGDFLKDMFKTLSHLSVKTNCLNKSESGLGMFNLALELSHNHRSESQLIVDNSKLISCMKVPTFDSSRGFHLMKAALRGGDNERDEAIRHLLRSSPDLKYHVHSQFVAFRNAHCKAVNELCCQFYNNHSIKKPSRSGKREKFDFRVGDKICLTKNNQVPSTHNIYFDKYAQEFPELQDALNKETSRLRERLNENRPPAADADDHAQFVTGEIKTGLDVGGVLNLLDQDDATFNTSIAELKEQEQLQREKEERKRRARQQQKKWKTTAIKNSVISSLGNGLEKLCNGEVFFIMDDIDHFEEHNSSRRQSGASLPKRYLLLSDRDPDMPRVVCVPFHELRKNCQMRHSWARTIHTYQGSESGTVVYVLGAAIPQTWQHVYTAVTRGRKSVYVLGDRDELHKAVTRRDATRRTRLSHRLQESLKDQAASVEICRKDFLDRQKLYLDAASGSDNHGVTGLGSDTDLLEEEFDSDNWLVQITSQQEKALIDEMSTHCRESATLTSRGDAGKSTTTSSNKPLDEPSTSNRESENCSNVGLGEDKQGHNSYSCKNFFYVSGGTDSEDEEEEESIFAPLHRFREKKQSVAPHQYETSEDIIEDKNWREEVDSDCDLVTQTNIIEENITATQSVYDDVLFEDDDSILLEAVSNQDSFGEKLASMNGSKIALDDLSPMNAEQFLDVFRAGKDNSRSETAHQPRAQSYQPSTSRVCFSNTSSSLNPTQDPTLHSPPQHNSKEHHQINGIHPLLKTPPKPSPETSLLFRDRQDSMESLSSQTPTKRVLYGEHTSSCDLEDYEGEASPSKLQRTSKVVGSPFLQSFSESLTLDTETVWDSPHRGRDQGESPFPARRKL